MFLYQESSKYIWTSLQKGKAKQKIHKDVQRLKAVFYCCNKHNYVLIRTKRRNAHSPSPKLGRECIALIYDFREELKTEKKERREVDIYNKIQKTI